VEIEEHLPRKMASKFLPFDVAVREHEICDHDHANLFEF